MHNKNGNNKINNENNDKTELKMKTTNANKEDDEKKNGEKGKIDDVNDDNKHMRTIQNSCFSLCERSQ